MATQSEPEITKMTYDEFMKTISGIPGATIFMAMPYGADPSTTRFVANTLLPTAREVTVDDEVVFIYGCLEDFNGDLWATFNEGKREIVAMALMEYHCALRKFLAVYKCRFYRLWDSGNVLPLKDSNEHFGEA
ncbi:hypothetical protein N0V82_010842 [Gnomoniopsis sp. IMI 355080]|nr:hypothetical protein N0V82_010842 [Gnomoniopsis sp. IMI 355080]